MRMRSYWEPQSSTSLEQGFQQQLQAKVSQQSGCTSKIPYSLSLQKRNTLLRVFLLPLSTAPHCHLIRVHGGKCGRNTTFSQWLEQFLQPTIYQRHMCSDCSQWVLQKIHERLQRINRFSPLLFSAFLLKETAILSPLELQYVAQPHWNSNPHLHQIVFLRYPVRCPVSTQSRWPPQSWSWQHNDPMPACGELKELLPK